MCQHSVMTLSSEAAPPSAAGHRAAVEAERDRTAGAGRPCGGPQAAGPAADGEGRRRAGQRVAMAAHGRGAWRVDFILP